ncbi:MAG TPA: hypothetical protein VL990_10845 [Acidobacteriaceae bacterium]|nr:hypothetical protein [Acidobacteriaceae bacterium]
MQGEAGQTARAILSLVCRVVLLGIAVPLLLMDFPSYRLPHRYTTEWLVPTICDLLTVIAPMMRTRKLALVAGAAAMGAHYYYDRQYVPMWNLAYMAVAIVFLLLPASGRKTGKEKWTMK